MSLGKLGVRVMILKKYSIESIIRNPGIKKRVKDTDVGLACSGISAQYNSCGGR